jgi:biofilm PGA synthesis N-glycosyltransferase PgaC
MNTLVVISLVIVVLYVLKIQKYKRDWENYPESEYVTFDCTTAISVVIAFRNEMSNLPALLSSLKAQEYPAALMEVILVNDHSDDGSDTWVQDFCRENANFRLIHNEGEVAGKKSAILNGIKKASNELIVTSDADCTMKSLWLATLAQVYKDKDPDMIVGLVDLKTDGNIPDNFQAIEFLSLVAAGAGALAGRRPIYCNGAFLAYKKSLFLAYPDPMKQQLASGDDTLFLHAVKHDPGKSILLLKSVQAIVTTSGVAGWNEFLQQRKRWVSKSLYYRDADTLYTALLVFLVNLTMLYSAVILATGYHFWLFPVTFAGKMVTDFLFLKSFFRFYQRKLPAMRFMVYELVYPLYVVFFAIAGISSGFSWKGRRFRT